MDSERNMTSRKHSGFVCPECMKDDNVNIEDIDIDARDNIIRKIMSCRRCKCEWTEFFVIKYDGFTIDDEEIFLEYDKDGNLISV